MREAIHTNHDDFFYLIASGGPDVIALKTLETTATIEIYGGDDGVTLLKSYTISSNRTFDLYSSDIENYPFPAGFSFTDMKGKKYNDDVIGECELFGILIKNSSSLELDYSRKFKINADIPYRVLEFATSLPSNDYLCYGQYGGCCPFLEFLFLYEHSLKDITNIAQLSFKDCYSLHTVISEKQYTSTTNKAFENCRSLRDINFMAKDATIGGNVFSGCYNLTEVEMRPGSGQYDSGQFSTCYNLTKVILDKDTTKIQSNFINNTKVKKLVLPEGILEITGGFGNCFLLRDINFPSSLTKVNLSSFNSCNSLETIELGDSTYLYGSLSIMMSLKRIVMNYSGYIDSDVSFSSCPLLESINFPNASFKTFKVYTTANSHYSSGICKNIPGTSSPSLGLETPILIDFANSFKGDTKLFQCNTNFLTLDQLKAIFDYLPIVDSGTFKCGTQVIRDETTGQINQSTAYDDFLV